MVSDAFVLRTGRIMEAHLALDDLERWTGRARIDSGGRDKSIWLKTYQLTQLFLERAQAPLDRLIESGWPHDDRE